MHYTKLTDLAPEWVGGGGDHVWNADGSPVPRREGIGLSFLCPCATCAAKRTGNKDEDFYLRVYVGLTNPIDGGPPFDPRPGAQWSRVGETFDTLTLRPSILDKGRCGWHGFVTDGQVQTLDG